MSLDRTDVPLRFHEVKLGQIFSASRIFDYSDMDTFAALSGDFSAIHTDPETAKACGFSDRLQYGFLLASILSRIVGENFDRAVCAAAALDFTNPVPANVQVNVVAEVTQMQYSMRSVSMRITMASMGRTVLRGKLTTIFLPEDQK